MPELLRFLRFATAGLLNTLTDVGLYTVGSAWLDASGAGTHAWLALLSGGSAMVQSFLLQRGWVFRSEARPLRFLLVSGTALLAGAVATASLADVLAPPAARLGGAALTALVDWWGYRRWVFAAEDEGATGPRRGEPGAARRPGRGAAGFSVPSAGRGERPGCRRGR
ncbi:MAG: GtrA family protein [Bacillota bacterium]|nr:GtrA family protein [Bacillota bacterium]